MDDRAPERFEELERKFEALCESLAYLVGIAFGLAAIEITSDKLNFPWYINIFVFIGVYVAVSMSVEKHLKRGQPL